MVAAAMHRRSPRGSEMAAALIVAVGTVIGYARLRARTVPGLSGAALVAWGASQVYAPAGWILGGLFLLAADRQIKIRPTRGGE